MVWGGGGGFEKLKKVSIKKKCALLNVLLFISFFTSGA